MKKLFLVLAVIFISVSCSDNATNTISDLKGTWTFQDVIGKDTFYFTSTIDEAAGLVSGNAKFSYITYHQEGSTIIRYEDKQSGTVTGSYIGSKLTYNFTNGSTLLTLFDGVYDKSTDRITGKCGYGTDSLNQPLYYVVIMRRDTSGASN